MKEKWLVLFFVLLLSNVCSAGTLGDVNGDGQVDLSEALYALQVTAGRNQTSTLGDVNGDGETDLDEAVYALQIIAGYNLSCDSSHLGLCATEITCITSSGNWWSDNTCNNSHESASCDVAHLDLCVTSSACTNASGNWWHNNTCNITEEELAIEYPAIGVIFANQYKISGQAPSAQELSRYNLIINLNLTTNLLHEAKMLNKEIEILRTSQGPWVNIVEGHYGSEIISAEGFQRDEFLLQTSSGTELLWWDDNIAFYNFASQEAVDWLANYVIQVYDQDTARGNYTGMYFDGLHYKIWKWFSDVIFMSSEPDIDHDRDGVRDTQEQLDNAWSSGIKNFLQKIIDHYPDINLAGNDTPIYLNEYKEYLNGAFFENHIHYWFDKGFSWFNDPWGEIIDTGNNWIEQAKKPSLSLVNFYGSEDIIESSLFQNYYEPWFEADVWESLTPSVRDDQKRMRFGLGVSCLSGALFSYDWGPYAYGSTYWWYPEYDANGRGVNYLGQATSLPEKLLFENENDLITNGSFESRTISPWSFYAAEEEGASGDYGISSENVHKGQYCAWVKSNISRQDSGEWHIVQISQSNLSFDKNKDYIIHFWARSSSPREATFHAHLNEAPWDSLFNQVTFEVTTEWQEYVYRVKPEFDILNGNAKFAFYVAHDDISTLYLDDIAIYEDGKIIYKRDFERGRVYVNDDDKGATIQVESGFFNLKGNHIESLTIDSMDSAFLITDPNWCRVEYCRNKEDCENDGGNWCDEGCQIDDCL